MVLGLASPSCCHFGTVKKKTTAAIDLWTRDTSIDDMNLHFYQVFHKMADTYLRATKNSDVAKLIHEFGEGFGKRLGLT